MRVEDIIVGERHRIDLGDIDSLARSIEEVGLLHPVVVTTDRRLIAGYRRLCAVRQLGWKDVPVTEVPLEEVIYGEYAENAERKNFTRSEAVAIGREIEALRKVKLEELKRERAQAQRRAGGTGFTSTPQIEECSETIGTQEEILPPVTGMSDNTYRHAKAVVEAAEKDPSLLPLVEEMDRTGNVEGSYNRIPKEKRGSTQQASWAERTTKTKGIDPNRVVEAMVDGAIIPDVGYKVLTKYQQKASLAEVLDLSNLSHWLEVLRDGVPKMNWLLRNLAAIEKAQTAEAVTEYLKGDENG